jgi:FlaA1/EpsC-like NDP-sugar epimerase
LVGFLDDDITKHGVLFAGVPVLGALDQLKDVVQAHRITELINRPAVAGV